MAMRVQRVVHTKGGVALLENFATKICAVGCFWSMAAYRQQAVAAIREQMGPEGASYVACLAALTTLWQYLDPAKPLVSV